MAWTDPASKAETRAVWGVGALLHAVADALQSRFNPVSVRGEITGFSRAASGHCYFSLKDEQGQIRCAMFRRAAQLSGVSLRDGQLVEATGKLDLYSPRGDLQLIVDSVRLAGQGSLFEQFLRLKAELEAQGFFDPTRKRPLPVLPRSIGVVTSLDAAALRDVVTALQRRVPHLPVTVFPSPVQGDAAPAALCQALDAAYRQHHEHGSCDILLLVRGGGSLEDLWAFNSPLLVRKLAEAPMPVVSGVGHETDFTLADFVADLRAATPTAAAELCAPSREAQLQALEAQAARLTRASQRLLEQHAQRLDRLAQRLGRPAQRLGRETARLQSLAHRLQSSVALRLDRERQIQALWAERLPRALRGDAQRREQTLARVATRLEMLDPSLVLQRGYAWLAGDDGHAITSVAQVAVGDAVQAVLADGALGLTVRSAKN
ncbi:MAG TPA: exodeoxyribonuclease VII large subunit [Macromonas sp.]|nr:exodeoxyribonuclease VII large subunit [Macromonas sp.]